MIFLLAALISALAQAAPIWNFSCDYAFMGMPTNTIALELQPDARIGPAARITMQGKNHLESFTEVNLAADELGSVERIAVRLARGHFRWLLGGRRRAC